MLIRRMNPTDNYQEAAQALYGTDPYIYPFWLDGVADKTGAISRLFDTPGSIFYRDNIYVAVEDGHIVGVMAYLHAGSDYSYGYDRERGEQRNFQYTYDKYFGPLIEQARTSSSDTAVLTIACILSEHRGKGYGKQMFGEVVNMLHAEGFNYFTFDCLADNEVALKVYKGAEFKIFEEGYGFNGFDPSRPPKVVLLERRFDSQ